MKGSADIFSYARNDKGPPIGDPLCTACDYQANG